VAEEKPSGKPGGFMQVRLPGGRWFNPERDLTQAFRRILTAAMSRFADWPGEPGCTREQFCGLVEGMRELWVKVYRGELPEDAALPALQAAEDINPTGFARIARSFFYTYVATLVHHIPEILPNHEGDPPLSEKELERLQALFADKSQRHGV
jgi:hypothetical protein